MSILSRFGIGSASVELEIPENVEQGQDVTGTLRIEGGETEQEVQAVYAALFVSTLTASSRDMAVSSVPTETSNPTATIAEYTLIDDAFTIKPDEERTQEVTIHIPADTPITASRSVNLTSDATTVFIETGLDIDWARDPTDNDQLNVRPAGVAKAIHQAMTGELDFDAQRTDVSVPQGGEYEKNIEPYTYRTSYTPPSDSSHNLKHVGIGVNKETQDGLELTIDRQVDEVKLLESTYEETNRIFTETDSTQAATQLQSIIEELVPDE